MNWRLNRYLLLFLSLFCAMCEIACAEKRSSESRPELSAALLSRYIDSGVCSSFENCLDSEVMLDRGGSDGYNINFYRVSNLEFAQLLIADILSYCSSHPGATANVAFYFDKKRIDSGFFSSAKPNLTLEVIK